MEDSNCFFDVIPADGHIGYIPGKPNYRCLSDGVAYKIRLINSNFADCDVDIYVNGKFQGTFRIHHNDSLDVERPWNVPRKFTLISETGQDAVNAGVEVNDDNGLVKVVFKIGPTIGVVYLGANDNSQEPSDYLPNLGDGVTVLGEHSNQEFRFLKPVHVHRTVTMSMRLVADRGRMIYHPDPVKYSKL